MDINRISTNQKHKHHHHSQVSPLPFPILNSSVNGSFIFWLALRSQPQAGGRNTTHQWDTWAFYSPQHQFCFQFQVTSTVNGKTWLTDDGKDFYSQLFSYILEFIEKMSYKSHKSCCFCWNKFVNKTKGTVATTPLKGSKLKDLTPSGIKSSSPAPFHSR